MGEPPAFKSVTELVTWMIALTFLALLGFITKKLMNASSSREAVTTTPEREHIEQGLGVSTAGVPDETIALISRLYADVSALRIEAAQDRRHIEELDGHIDKMIEGFEAGKYPPWPEKPSRP